MCHDNEAWCKIWRGITLLFQNWHKEFDRFWPEHSKVSKIFTLMGSFWAKYILVELKNYSGVIFLGTEEGYKIWRGIDLLFQNRHINFELSTHSISCHYGAKQFLLTISRNLTSRTTSALYMLNDCL